MSIPLAPAIIWYVFGLINSWSKLPIFGVPPMKDTTPSSHKSIEISFSRQILANDLSEFVNNENELRQRYGLCQLSVCHHLSDSMRETQFLALLYEWEFVSLETMQVEENIVVKNCSLIWQAKTQGFYNVRVLIKRKIDGRVLFSGQKDIKVLDYWVAAIGDSFVSGEGNPDKPVDNRLRSPAIWLSSKCHRSSRSWAYKIFKKLQLLARTSALHFTYIPCSGASSDNGILVSKTNRSQIDIIEQISITRGKGPDLLMMAVGGNDVGYGEILHNLLSRDTTTMFNSMEMRLFYAAHQLERIGAKLKESIKPTQVVVPHYFDLIRNEFGVVDSNCSDLKNIPVESLRLAEQSILKRVNKLISDKGKRYGWTVIDDVVKLFKTGGICSKLSLIRNTNDSLRIQGDTLGAFHPIEEAHRSIAEFVWRKLNFRQLMLI